ncbi:hypothetical protein [Allofournierella massiliensis]|uniref:hypothetical protein n=1 Tax=Allofournierella massiliensis TaxID=1650663 RepID=UPI0025A368A1|nr:hypothetical protein [Fournierella massiliensis]
MLTVLSGSELAGADREKSTAGRLQPVRKQAHRAVARRIFKKLDLFTELTLFSAKWKLAK